MNASDLTVAEKSAANVWDHLDDVLPILEAARAGRWHWSVNNRCKYIELRIDTRDGGCILRDADGRRINPSDFARQAFAWEGSPWERREELGDWQRETVEAMRGKVKRADSPVSEQLKE